MPTPPQAEVKFAYYGKRLEDGPTLFVFKNRKVILITLKKNGQPFILNGKPCVYELPLTAVDRWQQFDELLESWLEEVKTSSDWDVFQGKITSFRLNLIRFFGYDSAPCEA